MGLIAHHLRNEFGGYCSEEQVRKFIDGEVTGITNPWRDGGCKDTVVAIEENIDSDQESPVSDPLYGSYTPRFLALRNRRDNCWIAIDGYVYDVTPGDEGYDYAGPGSIVDLCGQDATDHFAANNLDPPPVEFLKGYLRSE